MLNLFGGESSVQSGTSRRQVKPNPRLPISRATEFEYEWEVRSYDPDSRRLDCRIHFVIPDPACAERSHVSRDAFRYDFRLWSVAELLEACASGLCGSASLAPAPTSRRKVPRAIFLGEVEPDSLPLQDRWLAYIVAYR